jgi:hypothetical protein
MISRGCRGLSLLLVPSFDKAQDKFFFHELFGGAMARVL